MSTKEEEFIATKIVINNEDIQRNNWMLQLQKRMEAREMLGHFPCAFLSYNRVLTPRICSLDEPFSLSETAFSHLTHSQASCIFLHNNSVYFCIITLPRNIFSGRLHFIYERTLGYRLSFGFFCIRPMSRNYPGMFCHDTRSVY